MKQKRLIQVSLLSLLFLLSAFTMCLPLVAAEGDTEVQEQMQIDVLHDLGYTGDGATIAIIDSGLINHSYFTNTELMYFDVSDTTITGPATSWDDSLIEDSTGHGTWVFGCAKQMAPDIDLVFYSIGEADEGNFGRARDALQHLVANHETFGIDILSLSWGTQYPETLDPYLFYDIEGALNTLVVEGVTIFIASGNEDTTTVSWPGRMAPDFGGIMSIGAVYYSNGAWFRWDDGDKGSNWGEDLELCAVGVDVFTTHVDGDWIELSGTSLATPIAAGSTACLLEQYSGVPIGQKPVISPAMIENRLGDYAVLGVGTPNQYGEGVIRPRDSMINWCDYVDAKTSIYGSTYYFSNLQDGSGVADFIEQYSQWYEWVERDSEYFSAGIPGSWTVDPLGSWFCVPSYAKIQPDWYGNPSAGSLISDRCNTYGASSVKVEFNYKTFRGLNSNFKAYVRDKYGNWDLIFTLGQARSWVKKTWTSSSSQYLHSNFQVKYHAYDLEMYGEFVAVDSHVVSAYQPFYGYRFSHEFEWTGVDFEAYDDASLHFSILDGGEDLRVEIKYGSQWVEVGSNLGAGSHWLDIGPYVTASPIEIRISDEEESDDNTHNQWTIRYLRIRVLHSDIDFWT
ncbi:MAG: S8 family serine peptidase [Candidatus Thorarchaeota archaeon]